MRFQSTSIVSNSILRVSIGISMVLIGISEYRDFAPFLANVTDGLGWMSFPATLWGYILPALLIFGGGLLAAGRYSFVAAWTGGIALGSIPIGLLLKTVMTGSPLPDTLMAAYPSVVWLMAFYLAMNPFPDQESEEADAREEA